MYFILSFIHVLLICLVLALPCSADVKDDLQGIKKEIREKSLLLKKTKKVETKVSSELQQIQKSLQEKQANLLSLGRSLHGVELNLQNTQREIGETKADADKKQQQINQRISSLYKAGEYGVLRMFFSAESFPQMVENFRYMKSVLNNDQKLFSEYHEKVAKLSELKISLEQDLSRKEKIKSSIVAKKEEIEQDKLKTASYLQKVREDKKGYAASIKELQANARRLQTMVERLEARSRKAYTPKNSNKSIAGADKVYTPVPDKGLGAQKGRLTLPVKGEISGRFGKQKHPEFNSYTVSNGISISAPTGSQIHAVYEGQVIYAGYFKGYGNMVIIDHGGAFFSLYGHASTILKKVGATVEKNEVVASVGDIDSTKGPMLYFEIRYQGKPVDPSPWFR
jgi:septal ring factor EnvC (AmiA/AmiB activator)